MDPLSSSGSWEIGIRGYYGAIIHCCYTGGLLDLFFFPTTKQGFLCVTWSCSHPVPTSLSFILLPQLAPATPTPSKKISLRAAYLRLSSNPICKKKRKKERKKKERKKKRLHKVPTSSNWKQRNDRSSHLCTPKPPLLPAPSLLCLSELCYVSNEQSYSRLFGAATWYNWWQCL